MILSKDFSIWQISVYPQLAQDSRIPAAAPEAEAMSKDLNKRGFTFVEPAICCAMMQSCGMVIDLLASCWKRVDN
ncbi:MAG: DNA-3-methyladenine glycosylase I [Chloroflexi bacterium]|nr:DNA-3-methyladenine glycosylase I [Chloroflexota bacterium]